ncbi:ATP-dependent rRNA helicase SPB4 [Kockovaella imperatae]|uniref:RNA helicase n=1 Tax=Kockovaella imperatae TaxID=4999 RepID=A0A1Y1U831_9TREE|nr:ATP-dependent rRNA helicase SPB4 [Kockovaella imperatae]ORX33657.1 ATP-dependent rRNA helicase SPB4 [Kockovaella imperatae]
MARRGPSAPSLGPRWANIRPELSPWILDVVEELGFERTTPVQSGVIPRAMKNQDCVVEAVTGSGKTLAFVIPVLERIFRREEPYKKGQVAAIVIAPTRELAQQIFEVFHHFISAFHRRQSSPSPEASSSSSPSPHDLSLPILVTSGSTNLYETFLSQSSNILIGTPGRLSSFLLSPRGSSVARVSDLDTLILDEADRLLSSPDHRKDFEKIMSHLPKQRRTHLFSATMTDAVEEMVGIGLRNPVKIVVNMREKTSGQEAIERRLPTTLQNKYLVCRQAEKTLQLIRLLLSESHHNQAAKFIIYFSTGAAVDYFYRILSRLRALKAFTFASLHGDLIPRIREKAMEGYITHASSSLAPSVLLCTDVAARGVDFEDVDVVLQFDAPTDPKTFSHRAGRTARAGRKGKAVILLGQGREEDYIEFLRVRKIPLNRHPYLDSELAETEDPPKLDEGAIALRDEIRKIVLTDREMADKAAKAYVSSLRAYTKHEASFVFRLPELDLGGMATAFGLLRLPAMPEVRDWKQRIKSKKVEADGAVQEETSWEDADVNWDAFAYTSKQREAARQMALLEKAQTLKERNEEREEKKRKAQAEMRAPWSEQKEKRAKKEIRMEKRDKVKAEEWERHLAEGGEDIGPVEAFKRASKKNEGGGEEDAVEYQSLKKELKAEKQARKARVNDEGGGGMFDDLD